MRWCPSIIVPSNFVFRQSFRPGANDEISASVESASSGASLVALSELAMCRGLRGVSFSTKHYYHRPTGPGNSAISQLQGFLRLRH